jgi:hypothetical protein
LRPLFPTVAERNADVTDQDVRPRYLGFVYATTSLAYIAGPIAGELIAE